MIINGYIMYSPANTRTRRLSKIGHERGKNGSYPGSHPAQKKKNKYWTKQPGVLSAVLMWATNWHLCASNNITQHCQNWCHSHCLVVLAGSLVKNWSFPSILWWNLETQDGSNRLGYFKWQDHDWKVATVSESIHRFKGKSSRPHGLYMSLPTKKANTYIYIYIYTCYPVVYPLAQFWEAWDWLLRNIFR